MNIRRARLDERSAVEALVREVATETFASDLIPHGRFSDEDWSLSWIAFFRGRMAGIVLTHDEWINDLWVLAEHRLQGIGRALLEKGEAEIAARGHRLFRLRVVKSNRRALDFYQRLGWQVIREFPHETLPAVMLEMSKLAPRQL